MLGAVLALALAQPRGPIVTNPALMSSVVFRLLPTVPTAAECAGTAITGTHGETITVTRSSSGFCTKSDGTLVSVSANLPRVEAAGLLVEPAATNLLLRSQEIDNATWAKDGSATAPTVTANATTAPDGTSTAEKIDFPAVSAGNYSRVNQSFTATAASHSYSIYLRADAPTTIPIFFLTTGTTFTTVASLTTSWQRFTVSNKTLTAALWSVHIGYDGVSTAEVIAASALPQSARTVYAWGGQAEIGPVATSYVATAGTQVTRTADAPSVPVTISSTAFSMSATVTYRQTGGTQVFLHPYVSGAQRWELAAVSGNSLRLDFAGAPASVKAGLTNLTAQKVQASYNGTSATASLDGVAGTTNAAASTSTAYTLYIGTYDAPTLEMNGWIKNVCFARSVSGCLP